MRVLRGSNVWKDDFWYDDNKTIDNITVCVPVWAWCSVPGMGGHVNFHFHRERHGDHPQWGFCMPGSWRTHLGLCRWWWSQDSNSGLLESQHLYLAFSLQHWQVIHASSAGSGSQAPSCLQEPWTWSGIWQMPYLLDESSPLCFLHQAVWV